jgi:hypothetical protein
MFDCATSEFTPPTEDPCRIGTWVYKQDAGKDVAFNITYVKDFISRIELITDQTKVGDQWTTNVVYKYIYTTSDSLYVKDFTGFKDGVTYLTAQVNGEDYYEQVQNIVTNFPANNGSYRFTFDYSKANQITVTMEKMNGSTATFDSRGVYWFDVNGDNVDSLLITRNPDIHGGDADNFTSRKKRFTYDIVRNPIKGIVMANFTKAELPDVTFFNVGNRLTEKYDNVTRTWTLTYGTDPMPTQMTTPDGVVEKYEYPNCTN